MASRTLFFVGKPPPELSREFPCLKLLSYNLVLREARPRVGGTVLVLDEFGLARVVPVLLAAQVRAPYTRVILAPRPFTAAALLPEWRDAGFDDVVAPGDLVRAVLEASRDPVVVRVTDAAWVPETTGDSALAADLIHAVPRLARPSVEEWAARAGVPTRTLRHRCRFCFDLSPRALLWLRTDAMVRQERARNIRVDVLARTVGFRDRHALYHAYRDRRLPFPPAGPRAVATASDETDWSLSSDGIRPAESDSRPARVSKEVVRSPRRDDGRPDPPGRASAMDGGPASSR